MHETFAGAQSVPVIGQALDILIGQLGLIENVHVINDEKQMDTIPPDAIFLAACSKNASFPNRFIRKLPDLPQQCQDANAAALAARIEQAGRRQFSIPEKVFEIPRLVLVRPSQSRDGTYSNDELAGFTRSLKELAGIRPERRRMDKPSRKKRERYYFGDRQPQYA